MSWAIDLDGVVWLGSQPIAGAADAVRTLREAGERVSFVTNNSSETIATYEGRLAAMDIPAAGDVISSATVAASLLEPEEIALVCAGEGVREALEARGVTCVRDGDADAVVVGYHRDFDYDAMARANRAVRRGARLVATNDDATYPSPDGPLPGGGAILASIVTATGVEPVVAGKPHEPIQRYLREHLGARATMVGDRPATDGALAVALGWRFVLVLSGVTAREDLPVDPRPDLVAEDLADAVARAGA